MVAKPLVPAETPRPVSPGRVLELLAQWIEAMPEELREFVHRATRSRPAVATPAPLDRGDRARLRELQPSARLVLEEVESMADESGCCVASNARLSEAAGICSRSTQNALRSLEAYGFIETTKDYSRASRRRIVLRKRPGAQAPR